MLSLKVATIGELNTIVSFAERLILETKLPVNYDVSKIMSIVKQVLEGDKNENVILLVCHEGTPVGVLGAAVSRPIWTEDKLAIELILYIEPQARSSQASLMLLRAYRYWAKKVGCGYISYASYKNGIEMNRIRKIV
jgi:hypothetical protein